MNVNDDSKIIDSKVSLGELLPDGNLPQHMRDIDISSITLDSRVVTPGGLFIAVKGAANDGRKFIDDAINKSAAAVLAESDQYFVSTIKGVPVLNVPELPKLIGIIAACFYRHPSAKVKVIGVTGTNGKSTCVSLIAQMMNQLGVGSGIIGTLGYGMVGDDQFDTGMTTPDAVSCHRILNELFHQGARVVAMEVSSHGIAQHRVDGIQFHAAAFTNLTRDHLDYHESFDEYGATKARLLSRPGLSYCVVNLDDDFGKRIVESEVAPETVIYTVSVKSPSANVHAKGFTMNSEGIVAEIVTPWGAGIIRSRLAGEFNLANLLTAIACVCGMGFKFDDVCKVISKLNPVEGRMQRVLPDELKNNSNPRIDIFIDYAHTPDALERALQTLKESVSNKLWVVFGCGGDRDKGKRSAMGAIAGRHASRVVITSDNPRSENPAAIIADIESGMTSENFVSIVSRQEAIEYTVNSADAGDCVLIAGKGHEKYQIIGNEKIFFDDYLVAKAALEKKYRVSL